MFRSSSGRSIRFFAGQNGRCTEDIENSKVRRSRHLDTSTTTQMAKIMIQCGWSSRSSRKEFVRSPSIMGKGIWESSTGTRLEKSFFCECLFVHRAKGLFLSVYVDDIKMAGKTEHGKYWWKALIWKNQPHSSTTYFLGCTQRECTISHDIVTNYRDMFEAWTSAYKSFRETWCRNHRSCKEMWAKEIANLRIKQLNNYTKSQLHAWMTINLKKRKMSQ